MSASDAATAARHRCPECGHAAQWTRRALIEAAQRWEREHGQPPRVTDWATTNVHHPTKKTVYTIFGSWPEFLEAAGLRQHRPRWTREKVVAAFYLWRFTHGRLPKSHEWSSAGAEHPCRYTVRSLFGSWNAGVVAAGYEPVLKHRSVEGYQRQAGAAQRQLLAEALR